MILMQMPRAVPHSSLCTMLAGFSICSPPVADKKGTLRHLFISDPTPEKHRKQRSCKYRSHKASNKSHDISESLS